MNRLPLVLLLGLMVGCGNLPQPLQPGATQAQLYDAKAYSAATVAILGSSEVSPTPPGPGPGPAPTPGETCERCSGTGRIRPDGVIEIVCPDCDGSGVTSHEVNIAWKLQNKMVPMPAEKEERSLLPKSPYQTLQINFPKKTGFGSQAILLPVEEDTDPSAEDGPITKGDIERLERILDSFVTSTDNRLKALEKTIAEIQKSKQKPIIAQPKVEAETPPIQETKKDHVCDCGPNCKCVGECKCEWPGQCLGVPKPTTIATKTKTANLVGAVMPWGHNGKAARAEATETGKPTLIHFYTQTCAPCKAMDSTIFNDPAVVQLATDEFVILKVDADQMTAAQRIAWNIEAGGVPQDYVVMPGWRDRFRINSAVTPDGNGGFSADPRLYEQQLRKMLSKAISTTRSSYNASVYYDEDPVIYYTSPRYYYANDGYNGGGCASGNCGGGGGGYYDGGGYYGGGGCSSGNCGGGGYSGGGYYSGGGDCASGSCGGGGGGGMFGGFFGGGGGCAGGQCF